MDKRLKIELTAVTADGWRYRIADGAKADGIMEGVLKETGGELESDLSVPALAKLWIVVHSIEEFLRGDESMAGMAAPLAQDILKSTGTNWEPLPIIHITTTDIFLPSLYTSVPLHRLVPRYYLIVDSSIWNYHVSIFDVEILREDNKNIKRAPVKLKFKESFIEALDSIRKNYNRHLYQLHVAREFADLNARMSAESYLTGAHAKGVSPFVFHSEAVVKQMIKDEFENELECRKDLIKNKKWRLLLVDDKAVEEMGYDGERRNAENGGLRWNCKLNIILQTLRHYFKVEEDDEMINYRPCEEDSDCKGGKRRRVNLDKCQILIEYAQTLEAAEEAMRNRTYDIVLLDYLLDSDKNHVQNYGFSLLNNIYNDKDEKDKLRKFKAGPSERFFFMFISAYTTAVYERLRAETLNLSEDFWHVSLGACPTNTPQLFLYNLLTLMSKRLKDSGLLNLSAQRIGELMSEIYHDASGGNAVRRKANKRYEKVLSLHYHYRKVMKDVAIPMSDSVFDSKGSVLMTEFAQKSQNLGGLLEHMANLVHITAFGTIRQWPEMWEEYLYFKALYEQLPGEKKEGLFDDIEKYILKLKQGQG